MVHHWPSWLQQGSVATVTRFAELFGVAPVHCAARPAVITHAQPRGQCSFCGQQVTGGWWHHVLCECTGMLSVSDSAPWRAFVHLLRQGHQGLALYICFPLFLSVLDTLLDGFTPVSGVEE